MKAQQIAGVNKIGQPALDNNYMQVTNRCTGFLVEEDFVLLVSLEDWMLKRATSNVGQ